MRRLITFTICYLALCGLSAEAQEPKSILSYYPVGMDQKTRELLDSAIENLLEDAVSHIQNNEIEKATKVLWGAISLSPNDERAYEGLAGIFIKYGQHEQLYRLLERATRYYGDADRLLKRVADEYLAGPLMLEPERDVYIADFLGGPQSRVFFYA